MGHSEHDPGFKDRRPWNAGRKLGAKRALKPQRVWAVRFWLARYLGVDVENALVSAEGNEI